MICEYGCGLKAKHKFKNGKWCCEKRHTMCPSIKKINGRKNKNKVLSNAHKSNISKSLKGKYCGKESHMYGKCGYWKNKTGPNKGVSPSLETRNKQSKIMKGRPSHKKGKTLSTLTRYKMSLSKYGNRNSNWKGGVSFEPYCEEWKDQDYKESIKERDGYKCLNPTCGCQCDILSVHHIDFNKKNCKPTNLITLCVSCNSSANKNRVWHKSWYVAILFRRGIIKQCENSGYLEVI